MTELQSIDVPQTECLVCGGHLLDPVLVDLSVLWIGPEGDFQFVCRACRDDFLDGLQGP